LEFKDRIAFIIKENQMKQKELAAVMGVTESYISTLLSGRNPKLSAALANLLEARLGYRAAWILTGAEPKYKTERMNHVLSDTHRRVIALIEKMPEAHVRAVLAFVDSLEKVEEIYRDKEANT